MYFILRYALVDDYLERRTQWRAEHLALAQAAVDRGELRLGGALAEPADEALLVFFGESAAVAERFAEADLMCARGWCGGGRCDAGRW